MSIAEVNIRRSEKMRVYWSHVKDIAFRQDKCVTDIRKVFRGKCIPTKLGTHFTGKRYHYIAKVKRKNIYSTVVSNKPLTKKQIRSRLRDIFEMQKDRYNEYGHWESEDFLIKPHLSSIDETIEIKTEGTRDIHA